jgi:F-type H+-transporting ATPase subunit epsilon
VEEKVMSPADASVDQGGGDQLRCLIVTPEAAVLDTMATFVALPLRDGEIGIAARHSPLIGRLGFGPLRVRQQAGTRAYYLDGGFVQVADNRVTVLTPRALPVEALDEAVMAEQLQMALARPAHGAPQMALRDRQVARARAQLRAARHAGQANA